LAIILLAAGISRIELNPGTMFDQPTLDELHGLIIGQIDIIKGIALLLLILAPLTLLFLPRRKRPKTLNQEGKPRRRSISIIILQIIVATAALLVIRRQLSLNPFEMPPPQIPENLEFTQTDQLEGIGLSAPSWVNFVFSFGLLLLILLTIWVIWRKRRRPKRTLDLLARDAKTAMKDIDSGQDFHNVILRCYSEMVQTLNLSKGIRREKSMTPREFESHLTVIGLPSEPVYKLTRLFESVRYGAKVPDRQMELLAVGCLKEIVESIGVG